MGTFGLCKAKIGVDVFVHLAQQGKWGNMVAVLGGRYATVPISTLGDGVKRVDINRFYDARAYKPKVESVLGLPLFMH